MIEEAKQILVNATRGELLVDACAVSHPSLTETVYITPFHPGFIDSANNRTFQYVPMRVDKPANIENLSQQYKIIIQDLGPGGDSLGLNGIVSQYLDQIPIGTTDPAILTVWSYHIDREQNVQLADGPYTVEIREFSSEPQGVGFTAEPQATNQTKCGERGTIERTGGLYRQFT